jgi:hypothetical protein
VISRVTIFSFLLALLLGAGIWRWNSGHTDACEAYLAGDKTAQATEYVLSGTRTIVVPCDEWLPRQPVKVQVLCLLDLVLSVVFLLHAWGDARDWLEAWRRRRAGLLVG